MIDSIKIRGARQHNLKNINADIPKNKFVVVTGISGSGKSSLAFDTIYAEGQRRYVESLSAYARQFLGIMDKPDVDSIDGLSPAISIDQKTVSHNPRSTVGTITEVYDYLRVLYARIGHPHCPNCGREITKLTVDEIADRIFKNIEDEVLKDKIKPHEAVIYAPVVRSQKGEFKDLFENLIAKGFVSVRIDDRDLEIDENLRLIKTNKHSIYVTINRLVVTYKQLKDEIFAANLRSRLVSQIETALNLTQGLVILSQKNKEHLYSEKFSCPVCNISLPEIEPRMFSFNSPLGACEKCRGLGTVFKVDENLILNKNLSISEGGILPFNKMFFTETWYSRLLNQVFEEEGVNTTIPISNLPKKQLDILLYGTGRVYKVHGNNRFGKPTVIFEKFDGIISELEKRFFDPSGEFMGMDVQKYIREEICESCHGDKLKPEILAITIFGKNIAQICRYSVTEFTEKIVDSISKILTPYEVAIATPILKEVSTRLNFLKNVGLGYLTVSRAAKTLSGGELQRIRLASQIGTGLTGVLYVLDEPSIGLHPKDVSALITTLKNLKELGNTLVVVEHDRETIEAADHILELGPHAGRAGGHLTFSGSIPAILKSKTLTGQFLSGKRTIEKIRRPLHQSLGMMSIKKAKHFNLKSIDVNFPLGNLIAVTGVSGSGKSTLIAETLYPALKYYLDGFYNQTMGDFERFEGYQYVSRVYLVDQSPIGRTPRSNPATYVGMFDDIREIFAATVDARAKGFQKGRFSFNLKGGRCEKCQGAGVLKIEMQFLSDVYITCDVCHGHRYNKETLEIKYKGKNIYEVLEMTVEEALDYFQNHHIIYQKLSFLNNVGLGYVKLGQPAPTFSGGEAQRIKLGNELSKREVGGTVYILDEPTTGLHFYDIEKLLNTLHALVERGNTVIVIEHNLDVIKNAQWIIDLGPGGGERGGEIVYQGELKGILKEKRSYTGQYLKGVNV